MFRARMSYKLCGFLFRTLPSSVASGLVRLLKLKIPTTPAALAACLVVQTGTVLEGIRKSLKESKDVNAGQGFGEKEELMVLMEILSALYCLAVVVLAEDEFASEPSLYQLYTAETFQELKKVDPEIISTTELERAVDNATRLYLHNNPSLAELAKTREDFCFGAEAEKVRGMNNWTATFAVKVKIQVSEQMGLPKRNIAYIYVGITLQTYLVECVRLFRQLRPVLVAP